MLQYIPINPVPEGDDPLNYISHDYYYPLFASIYNIYVCIYNTVQQHKVHLD